MSLPFEIAPDCAGENCTNVLTSRTEFKKGRCGACWDGVNSLDLLTQLKLAVSNAIYCEATPEYRHLVVTYELERMSHIIDELLKERMGE